MARTKEKDQRVRTQVKKEAHRRPSTEEDPAEKLERRSRALQAALRARTRSRVHVRKA